MTTRELINALQGLKVQTGSLACLGCGHEHNCGIHGCAIIREAIERISSIQSAFGDGPYGFGYLLEMYRAEREGRVTVLPGPDTSSVVQCRSCVHSYEDISGRTCAFGPLVDCTVPDEFFCANGQYERNSGGNDNG